MLKNYHSILLFIALLQINNSEAQEKITNKIHLTTGVGINKIQGDLGQVFRSTVAFNSGFERSFSKNWFGQLEVNFNSLKYDQKLKDDRSSFLFQNTNSSLFMLSVNGGKDFILGDAGWFSSIYGGTGYINIGEPRLSVDEVNNIVTQTAVRKGGILGKVGGRFGFNTKSKLLQTLYLDGSYWISSLRTQGNMVRSISVFLGMRMMMN